MELIQSTNEYKKWIEELKSEIQKSQIKAAISVNQALLDLYWRIGKSIPTDLKPELPTVEEIEKELATTMYKIIRGECVTKLLF